MPEKPTMRHFQKTSFWVVLKVRKGPRRKNKSWYPQTADHPSNWAGSHPEASSISVDPAKWQFWGPIQRQELGFSLRQVIQMDRKSFLGSKRHLSFCDFLPLVLGQSPLSKSNFLLSLPQAGHLPGRHPARQDPSADGSWWKNPVHRLAYSGQGQG